MNEVLKKISRIGIVPVIAISDVEKAVPLAKALVAGGIPCAEVTFRTAEGQEAIRRMSVEVPEILVGAGTVLTKKQVDSAIAAGAKFIVSPGFNPEVVEYCIEKGVPVTPGCSSPSDMEQAIARGLEVVKFFPAEQAGGLAFLKAVAAPYASLRFMPTGGINANNLKDYLAFEKIIACGGSWMVSPQLINEGKFDEITALCKDAVYSMLNFRMVHIGVNAENEAEAAKASNMFAALFGFKVDEKSLSYFASKEIEIMKGQGEGQNGHIAISTSSVERAMYSLENLGFKFRAETVRRNAAGNATFVYLKEEICGFAVHLLQA